MAQRKSPASASKRCTACHRTKRIGLFYAGKNKCKACFNKTSKNKSRDRYLKETYGISEQSYLTQLATQGGRCWICGGGSRIRLAVDHNHKNGKLRGLLCKRCNRTLGYYRDNSAIFLRASSYLESDGIWHEPTQGPVPGTSSEASES